jgi:hypothetical protein
VNLSDILGIAALAVAIIAIPITYYLAKRARQIPDLRFMMDFDILLRPDGQIFDAGLEMKVGDHPISCLSRTRIAFWNERGDTVRGADIVDADPLRIEFAEKDYALQAQIVSVSRDAAGLTVSTPQPGQSHVLVTFDFLDAQDGGIFDIVHHSTVAPKLEGTIRGAKIVTNGKADLTNAALDAASKVFLLRRGRYRFLYRAMPAAIVNRPNSLNA